MKPTFFIFLLLAISCKNKNINPHDNPSYGTINISVDASFAPVIEEELKMYKISYPDTKINATFKTEADCIKDLLFDTSCRMIMITRGLTKNEEKFFKDSLGYVPHWNIVAKDAIAVIVNKNNPDTLFDLQALKNYFTGKDRSKKIIFDGLNATSGYRFVKDSILKNLDIDTTIVKAAASSEDVIEYVSENVNAIGLVGVSWVGNPEDPKQLQMLNKIKIASIKCSVCPENKYVKPDQFNIQNNTYPLVRGLYYVVKENFTGLGSGFVNFLKNERGQLIFRRAYLAPIMDFDVRNVRINISEH